MHPQLTKINRLLSQYYARMKRCRLRMTRAYPDRAAVAGNAAVLTFLHGRWKNLCDARREYIARRSPSRAARRRGLAGTS